MALDSREKRASVPGVGRPWYRTKLPGATDAAWRLASGNVYAGNAVAAPPEGGSWEMIPPWLKRRRIATNRI